AAGLPGRGAQEGDVPPDVLPRRRRARQGDRRRLSPQRPDPAGADPEGAPEAGRPPGQPGDDLDARVRGGRTPRVGAGRPPCAEAPRGLSGRPRPSGDPRVIARTDPGRYRIPGRHGRSDRSACGPESDMVSSRWGTTVYVATGYRRPGEVRG